MNSNTEIQVTNVESGETTTDEAKMLQNTVRLIRLSDFVNQKSAFLDIQVNGKFAGRLTLDLFEDLCPLTCENFKQLCTGEKGVSKLSGKPLHYKGSKIHKVFSDYILQGGDFTRGDGRGGESIYPGGGLADEDLHTLHKWGPGTLAMANISGVPDSSNSQFFITLSN